MLTKDKIFELEESVVMIECFATILDCFIENYDKDYAQGMACANLLSSRILEEAEKAVGLFVRDSSWYN